MTGSTLVSWQDRGRAHLKRAARWHDWTPRWLPSRVILRLRQLALKRYAVPVLCQLPTGQQFFADPSDLVQCTIGTTGGWEQLIFEAIRPFVGPNETVLDIGAHVGYAALRFAEWVGPGGRVVCFEPVPNNVTQLLRNLDANAYQGRTVVIPSAVAEKRGLRSFYDNHGSNSGMGSLGARDGRSPSRQVRTVAIDDWLAETDVSEIALTKIDVEGAEALVVRGMAKSLAEGRHRAVLIELHPSEVYGIGRKLSGWFEQIDGKPYALFDWQPDREQFCQVEANEPVHYLLAIRRDSTSLMRTSA
jgi:FkbM family methyltransferase